jgi:hypothetical protein
MKNRIVSMLANVGQAFGMLFNRSLIEKAFLIDLLINFAKKGKWSKNFQRFL